MRASTEVEVDLDADGRPVATVLHCEPPLIVRVRAGSPSPLSLLMVGGAAGPLGGDELRLRMRVGRGASVEVRSVGATIVQPGPYDDGSTTDVHVEIEAGASLDWAPEPTISVVGSTHRASVVVALADDARLRWLEQVCMGRFDEEGGRLALHQRITIGGRAVLDHENAFGSGALRGPGAHGRGRWLSTEVVVDDDASTQPLSCVGPELVWGLFPVAPRVVVAVRSGHRRAQGGLMV